MQLKALVALTMLSAPVIAAQQGPPKPFVPMADVVKERYESAKTHVIELADRMPESNYTFRPTPEMETFAERIAHLATHNFEQCAWVVTKPNPYKDVKLQTKFTQKPELLAVLKESFAYCDEYMSRVSPETLVERLSTEAPPGASFRVVQVEKGGGALLLISHNNEMYGYLSVYLRLKGIVPPTSGRAK